MSLTGAMNIGRTALQASQTAIQVIGNNVANAATPGYSRQLVSLAPLAGQRVGNTSLGLGVSIGGVRRQVDMALQGRLWTSLGQEGAASQKLATLGTLETSLNELTGFDLSTQVSQFFSTWSERANLTKSSAVVVQQGAALASFMRNMRSDLVTQRDQLDTQLSDLSKQADTIVRQIADLNTQIPPAESGGGIANELRDRRDSLIGELSTLLDVNAVEQGDGTVNVLVGSTPIVLGGHARGITLERQVVNQQLEVRVLVGDEQRELNLTGGRMGALLTSRGDAINSTITTLDDLATQLIFEVNKLHSTGATRPGLESMAGTLSIALGDRTLALNDPANATFADLPFEAKNGGFYVEVKDQVTNTTRRVRIDIDLDGLNAAGARGTEDDTSAEDIRASLDGVAGLRATFDSSGRLRVQADEGFEFSFADDTSGALAVLGVNTYFTGTTGQDIDVRDALIADPQRLMVGRTSNGTFNENGTALAINDLRNASLDALGGRSLTQRWQDEVQSIGSQAAAAQTATQASTIVRESLSAQQASISGVSIDEEAINLTNYQRQYQGAARLVAVADQLLQELMNLI